ncbi:N-acetyltransferase family protein [Aestuariibius insulae]|uniref:GNAT family N-acetyltransferase n=1 Tax=Aestuariibius insulae TaxID=2058287 RepID=UPI00345EE9DB
MIVKEPQPDDIPDLAALWHAGWHEAHASIVPQALVAERVLSSFADRLCPALDRTRMAVIADRPAGLCIIKGTEIDQLYVSLQARGTGIAQDLLKDGEERLRRAGVSTARLACAPGNDRAARFYRKCGWHLAERSLSLLEIPSGRFKLDVDWFEKALTAT